MDEGILLLTDVKEKRDPSKIKCFRCQEMGHYARRYCRKSINDKPVESVNTTTTDDRSDWSGFCSCSGIKSRPGIY